ncbi:MAG: hypothetical protein LBU38_03940 [Propionibacteriaceae bacterium]|jgi:hypothetical protein|nr:hypothetical protein [Propionibacteriaceae bacterium]
MDKSERIDRWLVGLEATLAEAEVLVSRGHLAYQQDSALPLAFEALSNRVGEIAKRLVNADSDRFWHPIWKQAAPPTVGLVTDIRTCIIEIPEKEKTPTEQPHRQVCQSNSKQSLLTRTTPASTMPSSRSEKNGQISSATKVNRYRFCAVSMCVPSPVEMDVDLHRCSPFGKQFLPKPLLEREQHDNR